MKGCLRDIDSFHVFKDVLWQLIWLYLFQDPVCHPELSIVRSHDTGLCLHLQHASLLSDREGRVLK